MYAFALSKNGKHVVTGAISGDNCVWDILTGIKISCFATKSTAPFVAISPDGKFVISRSDDGAAHVWKAITGEDVSRITYHDSDVRSFTFSPDSKYIVTGGCDEIEPVDKMGCVQSSVIIWAADKGKDVARKTYDSWEPPVTFSPDGKYVVSGGFVWEPTTGKELAHIEACNYCDLLDISPDGKF